MSLEKHSAPGQALGYYFQLERALSWLAMSEAGSFVGIETEDDVVVTLSNGIKIMEQDKSSVDGYPFDPTKNDLWKTLRIWIEGINDDEIDLDKTTLYLVTNRSKSGSLAEIIGAADKDEDIKNCVAQIRKAGSNPSATIKTNVDAVLKTSDDLLKKLIKKIKYKDGLSVYGSDLRAKIASDLQLSPDEDADAIIEEVCGWTYYQVVDAWRAKKPAIIERDSFIRRKNRSITARIRKAFNDNAIEISAITQADHEKHFESQFVEQLRIINCDQDEIVEAIKDYLVSTIKKTTLSRKGYVTQYDLEMMEQELVKRWKKIVRVNRAKNNSDNRTPEDLGKIILNETLEHNVRIADIQTTNYSLTSGSYHSLADLMLVGWHPDYSAVLKALRKNIVNE